MACVTLGVMMDKLHEEMQDYLDSVLQDISEKYEIPLDELQNLYLGAEPVKKSKRAPRKAKESSGDDEKPKCSAKTAKGLPCKNKALAGTCFCKVHTKKSKKVESESEEEEVPKKSKKAPKPAPKEESDAETEEEEVREPVIDIEKMKQELFWGDGEDDEEEDE